MEDMESREGLLFGLSGPRACCMERRINQHRLRDRCASKAAASIMESLLKRRLLNSSPECLIKQLWDLEFEFQQVLLLQWIHSLRSSALEKGYSDVLENKEELRE